MSIEDKLIEITNDTPVIQPYGIKVELYLHQKVLVQKILDIIRHKVQFYDSNNILINNKNIWLKSSIGTGKSLILLSVIQELKNQNYEQINPTKVPVRNSLLYMVEHYDRNMNINYLSKDCFYYKLLNSNIYRMEMNKMQGYYVEGHKKIVINYPSFKKQALIFCQHQVISQFEEYIETQTSLKYKSVKDGTSFIKFALSDKSFDESVVDVILYDTNQLEPQVYLTNASSYIKTIEEDQNEFNSKVAQIQQHYKNVQSFNDFWQTYQALQNGKPYALIAFDDFDLIKFPNHFPLESIWNVFVGSTMIKMQLQNSNVCANFIMNKFIHSKTSLRIKEDQIQTILKLPKCTYENIICYTPNQVYIQFKGLLYLQTVFKLMQNVFIPQKDLPPENVNNLQANNLQTNNLQANNTYAVKELTLAEYQKILSNQLSFYDLFDQYLLQYKLPFKTNPNSQQTQPKQILNPKQQYSVWYLIDYIEYMKQLYEMNLLCSELKRQQIPQEQIQEYVNDTFSLLSEPLNLFIANCSQEVLDVFFNNLQRHQFQILQEEIDSNKLFNPFTNHQDLDMQQLVVCRCCGQLFNEKDIEKALFYEEGKLKCSFCLQYINDHNTQFLNISTQRYIKFDTNNKSNKVQFSEKLIENLDVSPISKDQILLKQIKENKANKKRILLYSNNINNLNNILQKEQIKIDDVYKDLFRMITLKQSSNEDNASDENNTSTENNTSNSNTSNISTSNTFNSNTLSTTEIYDYFIDLYQKKFYKVLNYGQINNFKNVIFQNIRFTAINIIKRLQNKVYTTTQKEDLDDKQDDKHENKTNDKSENKSDDKPENKQLSEEELQKLEKQQQLDQQLVKALQIFIKEVKPDKIDNTADIILVQSLDQIIGANITYIDVFIFYDVPETTEEIYQVIGRSRRIGRREDIQSYQYYYPLSKKLKLDL